MDPQSAAQVPPEHTIQISMVRFQAWKKKKNKLDTNTVGKVQHIWLFTNSLVYLFPFRRSKTHRDQDVSRNTAGWWEELCDPDLQRSLLSSCRTFLMVQESKRPRTRCQNVWKSDVHGVFRPTRHLLLHRKEWDKWKRVWPRHTVCWRWVLSSSSQQCRTTNSVCQIILKLCLCSQRRFHKLPLYSDHPSCYCLISLCL